MTRNLLTLICFITLLSCVKHDISPDPMAVACKQCGKSEADMQWMQSLIEGAKTESSLMGDIYAIPFDGSTIIAHQPVVMSCMACFLYDCDGNRIDIATIDLQKVTRGMNSSNRIFSSYPD